MRNLSLHRLIALGGLTVIGIAAGSARAANNEIATPNDNRPVLTVTGGQGGYVRLPDLTPRQTVYSLTGTNEYQRTLRAWQGQAGPMIEFGNARIFIPPTR